MRTQLQIRSDFRRLPGNLVNFAHMAIASTPAPVRQAVADHRDALDANPWLHLKADGIKNETAVCDAVSQYFGVARDGVALTTGTTQGLALLYGGLQLRPGQEILTTAHEFSGALKILDLRHRRDGTAVRRLVLWDDPAQITGAQIVSTLELGIRPETRILALTWVYSNSGVKLPLSEIGAMVVRLNRSRTQADQILLCVDGVHGFGVEDVSFPALGCAAFVAGCHKWACGPRGTGIWCGTRDLWNEILPTIATSSDPSIRGLSFSPGGVMSYEHTWAIADAMHYLTAVGPGRIRAWVHDLADQAKATLSANPRVRVITPKSPSLSSGIVCFDIDGVTEASAVATLLKRGFVTTVSSGDEGRPGRRHVRLSLAIYNSSDEVDALAKAVQSL